MKRVWLCSLFFVFGLSHLCVAVENDSLLLVLDDVVADRQKYIDAKQKTIDDLKMRKKEVNSLEELFRLNEAIIQQYSTFVCDSAEYYIHENISLAEKMKNKNLWYESRLNLALIYSLSGLFSQADEIFKSIPFDSLSDYLKAIYCWDRIRYCENLMRYTDDLRLSERYMLEMDACRDTVMGILHEQSDEYLKEKAVKLEHRGLASEAISILLRIYQKEQPGTHGYGMMSMGLAKAYRLVGNFEAEEKYLILSAMTDIQLAVKENEALLSLAVNLYHGGDIDRAYRYVKVALEDAQIYNSRSKNAVISRIYPIIEDAYLYNMEHQQRNLRCFIWVVSLLALSLSVALILLYKQTKAMKRARESIKKKNEELVNLNHNLDKANVVKEQYVAYFMNQCGVYINKLDEYRRTVARKIKSGQVDELYQTSSRPFDRELEDLYVNFDKAFLKLYPNFVEEFNVLIKPNERFQPEEDRLNTELRIFALMRLGISDVNQIAVFLHYTPQTIYNYKNKVKAKSILDAEHFDEEVRKLGAMYTF